MNNKIKKLRELEDLLILFRQGYPHVTLSDCINAVPTSDYGWSIVSIRDDLKKITSGNKSHRIGNCIGRIHDKIRYLESE